MRCECELGRVKGSKESQEKVAKGEDAAVVGGSLAPDTDDN